MSSGNFVFSVDFIFLFVYNIVYMTKKDKSIKLRQIKINEKTAEPTIINYTTENGPADIPVIAKDPASEKNKQTSIGKQIVMTGILGFDQTQKNIDRRQRALKRTVTIIFLVFVVAVLGYTFYNDFFASPHEPVSWENLWGTFSRTWYYFLLALLSLFLSYFFKGLRLSIICHSQTKKWHFKTCFETGIIGHYYNYVTPLAVGGQPFEIYHLSKHGVHGGVASSMPIIAFFIGQLAFVVMGTVSLVFFNTNVLNIPEAFMAKLPTVFNILAIIGLFTCILMPFIVIVFSLLPRAGAKLVELYTFLGGKLRLLKDPKKTAYKTLKTVIHNSKCIKKFAKSPLALIATFLISVAETSALCSIAFFTLKFFGYNNPDANGMLEWLQILQMSIILYAAISFVPTPGNSGAADLSFYVLFTAGLSLAGLSFTAMTVWRILSYYSYIIIGFVFTTLNRKRDHRIDFLGIGDLEE